MVNFNPNPQQLLQLLRGGNPKQVATTIIKNNFSNNPEMMNLLQLGERGDVESLKKIAQQKLGAQGVDVQTALNSLLHDIGIM